MLNFTSLIDHGSEGYLSQYVKAPVKKFCPFFLIVRNIVTMYTYMAMLKHLGAIWALLTQGCADYTSVQRTTRYTS